MKTLFEFKGESKLTRFVEYNGRKFRIHCEISNGDCVGFNSKCCLSVMSSDGDFKNVTDNRSIGIEMKNDYHARPAEKRRLMDAAAEGFEQFIKKIY